jgi:hypothetical protein
MFYHIKLWHKISKCLHRKHLATYRHYLTPKYGWVSTLVYLSQLVFIYDRRRSCFYDIWWMCHRFDSTVVFGQGLYREKHKMDKHNLLWTLIKKKKHELAVHKRARWEEICHNKLHSKARKYSLFNVKFTHYNWHFLKYVMHIVFHLLHMWPMQYLIGFYFVLHNKMGFFYINTAKSCVCVCVSQWVKCTCGNKLGD